VAQADLQFAGIEVRVPRADGLVRIVEHAHQVEGQRRDVAHGGGHLRPRHRARGRERNIAEVRLVAGPRRRMRHVQAGVALVSSHASPSAVDTGQPGR
jgi:hypothetical protein